MSLVIQEGAKVIEYIAFALGRNLFRSEVLKLSELLLMYSPEEVLIASSLGVNRYLEFEENSDKLIEESVGKFWAKLGGILYNRSREAYEQNTREY